MRAALQYALNLGRINVHSYVMWLQIFIDVTMSIRSINPLTAGTENGQRKHTINLLF